MAIFNLRARVSTPKTFASPRIVQNDIRVDFPAGEKHTIVRRQDGVYAIVAPASVTVIIESVTPAFTTDANGRKMNGAMLNPELLSGPEGQGFDSDTSTYNPDKTVTFPVTLSVGDVLVCAKSDPKDEVEPGDQRDRWGLASSYATFQVVASAPSEDSFAPPALTWPGKSKDTSGDVIDVGAFVDSLPAYSTANQNVPTFDHIYGRINRHAPVAFLQPMETYAYRHYQVLLPYAFNGDPARTNANHGQFSGITVSLACLALISDGFTRDQKIKIATALISHGIQWGDPVYQGGTQYRADGGHFQVMQGAVAASRAARGLDMSNFIGKVGGNWQDCFQVTQADLDKLKPHDDLVGYPTFSRKRPITNVTNNTTIQVQMKQWGHAAKYDYIAFDFSDMIMERVSDGATANVTSGFKRNGRDDFSSGTIDVQPAEPFAIGDVVYFKPKHTIQIGDFEWQDKGALGTSRFQWMPVNTNIYKNQQNWAGAVMLCQAAGWLSADPHFFKVAGYTHTAMSLDMPTAEVDYPDVAESAWERQFFREHGADIFA